jgi:hypothetical protein
MVEAHFIPPTSPVRRYRHGHKWAGGCSHEYAVWSGMRARCTNPAGPNYAKYGGRGISVCTRWMEDFVHFLGDMGRAPTPQHSIERIDNDGNYEPDNCRWATAKEQANNRRSSRYLTFNGETATLSQWADRIGLSIGTLHARLTAGWPLERALTEPLRRQ